MASSAATVSSVVFHKNCGSLVMVLSLSVSSWTTDLELQSHRHWHFISSDISWSSTPPGLAVVVVVRLLGDNRSSILSKTALRRCVVVVFLIKFTCVGVVSVIWSLRK